MELEDMLGLGSSSFLKSKGSSPFFGIAKILFVQFLFYKCQLSINYVKNLG